MSIFEIMKEKNKDNLFRLLKMDFISYDEFTFLFLKIHEIDNDNFDILEDINEHIEELFKKGFNRLWRII